MNTPSTVRRRLIELGRAKRDFAGEMSRRELHSNGHARPSPVGRRRVRRRRVLLVHANPFQRVTPVPAYGLERLRTAIEPTGAEVELIDPYLVVGRPARRRARRGRAASGRT